jgi:threonyl-tRNA synthetase
VFVIGDKEIESSTVAVRKRGGDDLGSKTIQEVVDFLTEISDSKE